MPHALFAAPYFLPTTLRFVSAVASLPGVAVSLVSADRPERLPDPLRARLAACERVEDPLDPEQIAEAARRLAGRVGPVDRLLGALEELQVPLGEVRDRLGIPGLSRAAAENFRDKARMKRLLREAGVACARHRLARSPEEARRGAGEIGFPLVVKPPEGSGSRGTYRLDRPEHLEQYLAARPPSAAAPVLLEEFLTGEEHSLETISIGGRAVWHSVNHYRPSALEVLEEPWIQWCVLSPRETDHPRYDDIKREAERALAALGMETGLTHMEWFRRPDGSVAISEVGARPPGAQFTTLLCWAEDRDLYRDWAELSVFGRFRPSRRPFAAGAAYFRGQGRGQVRAVRGLERVQAEFGPLIAEARLPRPGQRPSGGYEGEGYVILRHPETDVVARALARIVELVHVELG